MGEPGSGQLLCQGMFLQVLDSFCIPRAPCYQLISGCRCLWKDGVVKVKQCQSDRDGKGPSRLCPQALMALQPRLLDEGGETTPPTPFLVIYQRGRADSPVIPGCWTLRSGSSSHQEQFMASVTAQAGHCQGQSKVWHLCFSRTSSSSSSFCPLPTLFVAGEQPDHALSCPYSRTAWTSQRQVRKRNSPS